MSTPTQRGTGIVVASGALAAETLCEAFAITARTRADEIAIRTADDRVVITWRAYGERVRRITEGLHALGLRRGDTVALLLSKRPEFHLVDAAALHLGAVPFSVYDVYAPPQVAALIADSGARIVVTDTRLAPTIAAAAVSDHLDHVVVVDGEDGLTLDAVERRRSPGFDFGRYNLAIAGLEPESELARAVLVDLELAGHHASR